MADIAAVFHWPLDQLTAMSLDELLAWRQRAVDRWSRMNGKGDG
ncbi:MAG: GpE family phage tail protein [Sphingomonas sp.]|nr:GpE family phage tail protein [Sphingomonas sp.]